MVKNWYKALESIKPLIFKIKTPDGYGTGFQIFYSKNQPMCGIATAYHVIDHADEWEESIKIIHEKSGKYVVLKEDDRVIFPYPEKDLAFILFNKSLLPLEPKNPKLINPNRILKQGVEIGWCGFPSIAYGKLCFFAGHVSCCLENEDYYLVDGVAINGVSGGPAFYIDPKTEDIKICGVISAYRPNRVYGEVHPGLSKVCSVEPYQKDLKSFRTKDAAAAKAKEEKEKRVKEGEPEKAIDDLKPKEKGD